LRKTDKDARPPGFKGKKHFMSLVYNQSGFKFENGKLTLNHYYNDTPLSFDCEMIENVKQITVSFDKQFYVSVVYETEVEQLETNHLYQATDLGITKTTSVNMHGKFFESINPRPDKYWNKIICQVQSRRDLCKKNSRRWNVLNNKLQKAHKKRSNQMKDYQHKLSRRMVDNTKSNILIIGDLSVKKMSKKSSKGMNRSTQNTGYLGRFSQFLTYKGNLVGKTVTKIDEKNTTKTCYVCGKQHLMQLRNRVMKCDCGNEIDRDKNSSINIMIRYLSQNALWTGFCEFRKNLRASGLPEPQESRWFDETPPVRTGKTIGKFIW
jgi:putative transposase